MGFPLWVGIVSPGDAELDHLRQRLRETELAMERIVEQMSKVPLKAQVRPVPPDPH